MVKTLYSVRETTTQSNELPPTWRRAETVIAEEYDLDLDHGSYHDARTQIEEPVEIKSCANRYADGRLGRFKIFESQWRKIRALGQLALLVYNPNNSTRNILATHMISRDEFSDVGTVHTLNEGGIYQRWLRCIPWPEVIPLDAIIFGLRHHFVDHYSEAEIEETLFMHPEKVGTN